MENNNPIVQPKVEANNNKSTIILLLVGIVVIFAAVGGIYWYLGKQQSSSNQQSQPIAGDQSAAENVDNLNQQLDAVDIPQPDADFTSIDQDLQNL
ncbi:hypothetical protein HYW41_05070 [Candidatus Daviesbacteria bacterium]|nr:hypothetical protein [Candidatus Daviesbacteria bacterium]